LRKATPRRLAIFAIGLLLLAHVLRMRMVIAGAAANAMEYNTFTRLDPIALGILVALAAERLPSVLRWQRWALMMFGLSACIAAYAMSALENHAIVSTWYLAASHSLTSIGSVAVMLAVLGATHSFFRNKALIYLGKISYGLYVIHEFAHLLARQIFPAASPMRVLMQSGLSLAITVVLAAASYRWLETPFLRLKERHAYVRSRPV
jgi:peptidoglycan/LPS O-acetylase OafA/YrhL